MKLIIDISYGLKDVYEHGNVTALDVEEMKRALQNGTPIPDNATNESIIYTMFDRDMAYDITSYVKDYMLMGEWLNAPYQKVRIRNDKLR